MAKKISYNGKALEELQVELNKLRGELHQEQQKVMQGKSVKDYRLARKNIARVMTAINSTNK